MKKNQIMGSDCIKKINNMKKRKNKHVLLVEKAFQEAVAEALEKHSKLGVPLFL